MGLIDGELVFSKNQEVLSSVSTGHNSTNLIDTTIGKDPWGTARAKNPGEGGGLWLIAKVTTAFTSDSPATASLAVAMHEGANATPATGFTATSHAVTGLKSATLVKGYTIFRVPLQAEVKRYLQMLMTITGKAFLTGKIFSFISMDGAKPYSG